MEDIDDGDPNTGYGIDTDSQAEMILASQLYASGGLPQLKYPSDRTYPVFYLAQTNSDLLNSVSPYSETAVLMSQAQTIRDRRGLDGLLVALQDINRSSDVLWLKSNLLNLQDDFTLNELNNYKAVFLPEVFYLTDNQKNVLLSYMENGGTVVAVRGNVEYCGQYDENGNTNTVSAWTSIANQEHSGVFTYGNGRYINIAHNILESNGYPPPLYGMAYLNYKADPTNNYLSVAIRDTIRKWMDVALPVREVYSAALPLCVRFFRYQDSTNHRYLYHVLSDSVDLASRKPIPAGSFEVELAVSPASYNRLFRATWFSIDNPQGVEIGNDLTVNQQTGRITVTIPSFSRWGFVHLDGSGQEANSLQIGHLAINGSTEFRRLKSQSSVTGTWDILSGTPDSYEIEVWTNIHNVGSPVISEHSSGETNGNTPPGNNKSGDKYILGAKRLFVTQITAANPEYTIPANTLHDSIVYLLRVRAIQNADTSDWIHNLFYRNARPGAPHESQIYNASQDLWYLTDNNFSPVDTSYHPIIAFSKAENYGGDYELDSLLFGIYVYTDSLPNQRGDTTSTLHLIGTQFKHKLAWNQSMPNARGDIQDTIGFSLEAYENYGIYFRAVATDLIDTSAFSPWFWFYVDNHNDPPNPFHLIEPGNYSVLEHEIPFLWQNNGDPDPNNKQGLTISRVEILFDSVPSFNSPGLKTYSQDRNGNEFEQDTIKLNLPSNYFHAEGLDRYDIVYWKARLYDYDWHSADGSNRLYRESSEVNCFYIGSATQLKAPALRAPANHEHDLPLDVRLEWQGVAGAQYYILQVAKDVNFQNKIMDIPNITATNFTIGKLEPQTTYYWRVKCTNTNGQSEWSSAWTFTTTALPDPVALLFPEQNAITQEDTIHFVWHKSMPFAEKYCFEYSGESGFGHAVVDSTVTDTVFSLAGLTPGQTYYWRVKALNSAGWGPYSEIRNFKISLTAIRENRIPDRYFLSQNYPNPFNPSTHISFTVPQTALIQIVLFNAKGQKVKSIFEGQKQAGQYELTIDMAHLPSGIYFCKMRTKNFQAVRKLILLK